MHIRINSYLFGRLTLALFLIAVVVWLATDRSSAFGRLQHVYVSWKNGHFDILSQQERDAFIERLEWLSMTCKEPPRVVLNGAPSPDVLNVYTVNTEKTILRSFCQRGNAIYDAELDAIFLDIELFRQSSLKHTFRGLGDSEIQSVTSSYLNLIILHELGHRELHANDGGFFDSGERSRADSIKYERDADAYALSALNRAYKIDADVYGGRFLGDAGDLIGLKDNPIHQVWIDTAVVAHLFTLLNMFSDTPYSSFFYDASHPTWIDRSAGFLNTILREKDLPVRIRSHIRYSLEYVRRLNSAAEHLICEITVPEPLGIAALGPDGLYILSREGYLYYVPSDKIENTQSKNGYTRLSVSDSDRVTEAPLRSRVKGLIHAKSSRLLAVCTNGDTYLLKDKSWVRQFRILGGISELHFTSPLTESFIAKTTMTPLRIVGVQDGKITQSIKLEAIETEIANRLKLDNVSIEIESAPQGQLFLRITYGTSYGQLWGFAEYNLVDFSQRTLIPFQIDGRTPIHGSWASSLLIADGEKRLGVFLGSRNDDWTVHSIAPGSRSKHIASHPSLAAVFDENHLNFSGAYQQAKDPLFHKSIILGPHRILASYHDDSVYLIDFKKGVSNLFFHPGGIEISPAYAGRVVLNAGEEGRKLYILTWHGDNE